jgi:hypothetical protein
VAGVLSFKLHGHGERLGSVLMNIDGAGRHKTW